MRIDVKTAPSLKGLAPDLTLVAVTQPFDRGADDLELGSEGAAAALVAEASRVAFEGELGTSVVTQFEGRWYGLIGAGASPKPTAFRRVGAAAVRLSRQVRAASAAILGANSADRARFTAEGAYLTGYAFDRYKTRDDEKGPRFRELTVVASAGAQSGVQLAVEVGEAICVARDLANEHPGRCKPAFLAETARELAARYGFACTIRDEEALERDGFALLLAVGRGSAEPSQLIHLVYKPKGKVKRRIAFVGKGVTYDSGGYSIKPADAQINMHLDMGGAAAVLGAADAIGRTKPAGVEVHFIVPTVENLVSGNAYKLNEIIKGYGGTTVEILNTDAEGRLILADALSYALEQEPDEIVDLATLTGACVVALGNESAGLFSNDDALAQRMLDAAAEVDESMWRMPLTERIDAQLKSDFADVKNVGSRWGGAISAALFLRRFVGDCAWAHIDIAGPAMMDKEWEYICKGGTGFGVAALHEYARRAGAGR